MTIERGQRTGQQPYIPVVVTDARLTFVSGQIPFRNGVLVAGGIEEQTTAALQNIAAILDSVGATLADVIRCGVFVHDLAELPGFNKAYVEMFGDQLPTRTAVGAVLPGYKVEIDCIAVISSSAQ